MTGIDATIFALGLSVLSACSTTVVDPLADQEQVHTSCEPVIESETPCRGLLPGCAPSRPSGVIRFVPLLVAYSTCPAGRYSQRATVVSVVRQPAAGLVMFELENVGCSVLLEIRTAPDGWPQWPWLAVGYLVDVSMDDSGDETRGGNILWFVIREVETQANLAIVYQYDTHELGNHRFGGPEDLAFELSGPTCEKSEEDSETGLLVHEFELRVSSANSTSVLSPAEAMTLAASDGRPWRVETGALEYTYSHLLPPEAALFDIRWGGNVSFVAWPEP